MTNDQDCLFRCGCVGCSVVDRLRSRHAVTKAPAYVDATYNWSGVYVGADVGYGFGRSSGTMDNFLGLYPKPYANHPSGVSGGGFVGANYQFGRNWVIGIEADWQAASLKGSTTTLTNFYSIESRVSDYGSVRGRLGYAFDRFLVFGTGGAAWGSFKTSYAITGLNSYYTNSASDKSGWAAGIGIEYAATNNLLVRLEYRYTDLGTISYLDVPYPAGSNSQEHGNHLTMNDIRAGVAYKF